MSGIISGQEEYLCFYCHRRDAEGGECLPAKTSWTSLKFIGQLHAECPTVLPDNIDRGKVRTHRVTIVRVEQVIQRRGEFQSREKVFAEESQVGDVGCSRVPSRLSRSSARVLFFNTGKDLLADERSNQVEFGQVSGRIGQGFTALNILGVLDGVAEPSLKAV